MLFAFTADLHLSRFSNDEIDLKSGLPIRLLGIKNALYNMADYCLKYNIPNIIIGGDIYHGKSVIYSIAQSILLDFIRQYHMLTFIIIDGNHDMSGKGCDVISALKSIDKEPNVIRFNGIGMIEDILFVPYGSEMVESIKKYKAKFLISHCGLNEATLTSGISIVSDIRIKDLIGRYQYVLLGHYHKPQEIKNENLQIYYAGSPTQLDLGERDLDKRFLIVDTKNDIITSIPTEGYKRFYKFQVTQDNKKDMVEKIKKLSEEGHFVCVEKDEKIDLDLSEKIRVFETVERDVTNRGITSSMGIHDQFSKYLEIKNIREEERNYFLEEAIDIVNSCYGLDEGNV